MFWSVPGPTVALWQGAAAVALSAVGAVGPGHCPQQHCQSPPRPNYHDQHWHWMMMTGDHFVMMPEMELSLKMMCWRSLLCDASCLTSNQQAFRRILNPHVSNNKMCHCKISLHGSLCRLRWLWWLDVMWLCCQSAHDWSRQQCAAPAPSPLLSLQTGHRADTSPSAAVVTSHHSIRPFSNKKGETR